MNQAKTLGDQILEYIGEFPGTTDAELAVQFRRSHQTINSTCRNLAKQKRLLRQENPDKASYIGNYILNDAPPKEKKAFFTSGEPLQEEAIKHILTDALIKDGWDVQTAWGHTRGADIDAKRGCERWLIEVKGVGASPQARVNYFLGALGEILQRMDDKNARYSIAFPKIKQYKDRWENLPKLAKERTSIDLLLIDSNGDIEEIK